MRASSSLLERVLRGMVIVFFSIMVVSTIAQVISRYFVRYPLGWTEELARIMFIWSAFLSVGLLAGQNMLLKIEAFLDYMPQRVKDWAFIITGIISGFSSFWLAFLGIRLLDLAKTQLSPALRIPYWYIYLSLPLGLALSGYYMISHSLRKLTVTLGGGGGYK